MTFGKKIGMFFGIFFLLVSIFYTGVFINYKNNSTIQLTNSEYISDISNVKPQNVDLVNKYVSYFELDSNGNFNPSKSLSRIDAILIVDKIAKQLITSYNTTKPSVIPYFEDFKSTDSNSDSILRVVNIIDNKTDFYKHYNILGYQLKRQDPITEREFLTLLAVFSPIDKQLGEDYVLKNLANYSFVFQGDLNSPITRENATIHIDTVMKNFDQK